METVKVRCKMDFAKSGTGENARGLKGEVIEVSPDLAAWLIDKNIVELYEEPKPRKRTPRKVKE